MKRLTFVLLFVVTTLTSFAQNRIDLIDFVNTFDWKLSEIAFKEKYNNRIVTGNDSISNIHAETGNWLLSNLSFASQYESL